MSEQKRASFRVEFPINYHPSVAHESSIYDVHDLSEFGVKFKVGKQNPFSTGEDVDANIIFPDGEKFKLVGQIIRIDGIYAIIHLSKPIPLSKVRSEHLHLIQNYMA